MKELPSKGEPVFHGHIEDCLREWAKKLTALAPKHSKKSSRVRQPMADFCGVEQKTVKNWLDPDDPIVPVGEILIRLICYFSIQGYQVAEFDRLPQIRRNFSELVGFGIFSGKEAAEKLEYSTISSLYHVLKDETAGLTADKQQLMWDIWKKKKKELECRKAKALEDYFFQDEHEVELVDAPTAESSSGIPVDELVLTSSESSGFHGVICIMEGLTTLLKEGKFAHLSGEELKDFRRDGWRAVLGLSTQLNQVADQLGFGTIGTEGNNP